MPAKLQIEWTFVKLRLETSDLELLTALHASAPGGVNGAVRTILSAYCNAQRRRLEGVTRNLPAGTVG